MQPPTSAAVLRAVADAWEMPVETITSPARDAEAVAARDAVLLLLVEEAGLTGAGATRQIGRMPDPSYVPRARLRRQRDGDFAARLEAVRRALRGEPARCPHCGGALGEVARRG
jgi:hypothetical protein